MTVTTNDDAPGRPEPAVPGRPPFAGGPLYYGPPLAPQHRRSRWVWVAAALAFVLMLAIGAVFVRVPYYEISPGSARQIDDLIRVDQPGRAYPPTGDILLTTVSLGPVRNVYDALGGWLDPAVDVLPEDEVLGPAENRQQYNEANLQAMTDSKQLAEYVAFRHLGYDVSVTGQGALVVGVVPGTGAASTLQPGEVIIAAEGRQITLAQQLIDVIRTKKPGDPIRLSVKRADDESQPPRDVEVKLSARDDGSPLLGITQQTWKQEFHFPFAVNIDSGQIGGPSAGLAFTLAVLDVLTPGELTGGQRIAATGTIDPDGNIGPVGGVAQKTVAVKRAGATLFLVPKEEYAQAKARAGDDVRVEQVETLADALKVLASLQGSNALALGRPGGPPR